MRNSCVESACDCNSFIIVDGRRRPPSDYRDSFHKLGELGVIPKELVSKFIPLVSLRNRIVHEYETIKNELVYASIKRVSRLFRQYVKLITEYIRGNSKQRKYKEVNLVTAKLLDGEALAGKIKEGLKKEIEELKRKGITPSLAAVQVGENPASRVYIRNQRKSTEEVGIDYQLHELVETTSEEELLRFIEELNWDSKVTGVILQMPVPGQINARRAQMTISPSKDVEGMNPVNMGMLVYGQAKVAPCTARGAMELLRSSGVELKGKEVTVVGHSEIVGKPITLMLLESLMESPTPTVCHIATKDLAQHTKRADILIVAVGKAGLIKGDMVKEGAIVIDIGINRVPLLDEKGNPVLNEKGKPKKKTVGDVVFEEAAEKASYISPVPGGVGPLTTAMLLKNTVECAKAQKQVQ